MIYTLPAGKRKNCGDRKLSVVGSKMGTETLDSFTNRQRKGRILKLCMRFMSKIKLSGTLGKSNRKQPVTSAKSLQFKNYIMDLVPWIIKIKDNERLIQRITMEEIKDVMWMTWRMIRHQARMGSMQTSSRCAGKLHKNIYLKW